MLYTLLQIRLRGTLNEIIMNATRDLRNQADEVDKAFKARINCTQEILNRLENELRKVWNFFYILIFNIKSFFALSKFQCLETLVATEKRIEKTIKQVRNFDNAMKLTQTRLDNRHQRQHVENCRDHALQGLVDDVKTIEEAVSAMFASVNEAEKIKEQLITSRINLEKEIMLKRYSIEIDKICCSELRSHFPSAAALSGFANL